MEYTVRGVSPRGNTYHVCTGFASIYQAQSFIDDHQHEYEHKLVVMSQSQYDDEEKKTLVVGK